MKRAVWFPAFLILALLGATSGWLTATGVPPPIQTERSCDVNGDQVLDVSDVVYFLQYLFLGGPAPVPLTCSMLAELIANGDSNGDGTRDVSDTIHLVQYLFMGGPSPASCEE